MPVPADSKFNITEDEILKLPKWDKNNIHGLNYAQNHQNFIIFAFEI